LGFQPLHRRDLAVGQHLGHHLVDAQLARDGICRAGVVAGYHRHGQAKGVQGADGLWCRLLDRVGHGQDRDQMPVDGGIKRRLAVVAQPRGVIGKGCNVIAQLGHVAVGADLDPLAARPGRDAVAGHG